ncbi:MAG: GTPase domain-containing protein, partial [Chthoniobacteraceae bacterium]
MIESTPTFAIVGAVNHGKSSVVSTLSENDQVRISSMPGETVECQKFWLGDLFVFYDTPGFQNAIAALEEIAPAAQAREPLAVFSQFIERHRGDKAFEAECVLFEPIIHGAGIVYVVDGSEPVLDLHAAEMEILRLTGQPRLAVINRTSRDD